MDDKTMEVGCHYLLTATREFMRLKALAEKAIDQISEERRLNAVLDKESNSIAILMRHLSGNMISRWTDFLTTDGENPDRNRDGEFESAGNMNRSELMVIWNRGWSCLFRTLKSLSEDDLTRRVTIRGEEHSVMEAIQRHLAHYAYHVGQIVYLSKHLESEGWKSLSIPRGQSSLYFRRPGYFK